MMEQEIKRNAKAMAEILANDYDVLLKKVKGDTVKILYYRPKNLNDKGVS